MHIFMNYVLINNCIVHFPCKLYIRSLKECFRLLYRYVSHLTKMFIACDSSSGETADSIYRVLFLNHLHCEDQCTQCTQCTQCPLMFHTVENSTGLDVADRVAKIPSLLFCHQRPSLNNA